MKKIKQMLAVLGIILLVGLYVATLLCAIFDRTETMSMFRAAVYATVIIPVLLWAYIMIYRLVTGHDNHDEDESDPPADQKNKEHLK
jgi:hypothetical protein